MNPARRLLNINNKILSATRGSSAPNHMKNVIIKALELQPVDEDRFINHLQLIRGQIDLLERSLRNKQCPDILYTTYLDKLKTIFSINSFNVNVDSLKRLLSYYGAGLMGKAEQLLGKNLYAEGSLRFGRSKSEYNSHDFYVPQHLGGSLPEFDLESTYYGVHLGVGYVFDINDSVKLDTSAKYLWTHLEGDSVTLLGDRFNFDDIDSHRLQVGGRLSWVTSSGKATPYIGAKYEYEFDGKAGGSVRGFKIESSDTKGSSGLLEAGVKLHTSLERLFIDLGVNGSFGQRESIGGHVALRWDF